MIGLQGGNRTHEYSVLQTNAFPLGDLEINLLCKLKKLFWVELPRQVWWRGLELHQQPIVFQTIVLLYVGF
jgi:hypothetical protein